MKETHCKACGTRLTEKYLEHEWMIPFCETCGEFRFPGFNVAVSMIVKDPAEERILLIKQYGRDSYVLTAGYVNMGEDAEDAAAREVREELGAQTASLRFSHSRYYAGSNTLMLNFVAVLRDDRIAPNHEIDSFAWFTPEAALEAIRPNSLAKAFLAYHLGKTPDVAYPAENA